MSNKINHRSENNREKVDRRYSPDEYNNGYARKSDQERMGRVGKTGYLDKSMHSWGRTSEFADIRVGASIGNDFTNGHRGMAHAVKGAKKFVKTRIRFHENAMTKKLVTQYEDEIC